MFFLEFITTQSRGDINNENPLSKGYTSIVKYPTVNATIVKCPAVNIFQIIKINLKNYQKHLYCAPGWSVATPLAGVTLATSSEFCIVP